MNPLMPDNFRLHADSARTGEPIVRLLDYAYTGQGCAMITDQFLLGPSVVVAPVLKQGARERSVQFPPGDWKGDEGSVVHGPCVMDVKAPLNRLPWYRKLNVAAK